MILLARRLLDRLRSGARRADEAHALRLRLSPSASGSRVSTAEAGAAREARALAGEIAAALGEPAACRTCAVGKPDQVAGWPGGRCCESPTSRIFDDEEVALLAAAGVRPEGLRLPAGAQAGCAFRGPRGCALSPVDRPTICARYLCPALERELHARGDLDRLLALTAALGEAHRRFAAARARRLDDEASGIDAIDAGRGPPATG